MREGSPFRIHKAISKGRVSALKSQPSSGKRLRTPRSRPSRPELREISTFSLILEFIQQ